MRKHRTPRPTRTSPSRRAHLAVAAALALLPAALSAPAALAAEPAPPAGAHEGVRATAGVYGTAASLERVLGDRSAGSYLDARTGELVVTVTGDEDAARVRAAGARPERVTRTGAELHAAMDTLERKAKIPGTLWGIDPRTNQVSVEADSTVSEADLARLRATARAEDGAIRVERVGGHLREEVLGGAAIYGGGYRCSAAFNVVAGGTRSFLTAGHCTNAATDWRASSGGAVIGQRTGTSFPDNDYGIVRYTDGSSPAGTVDLHNGSTRDITSAADAVVGQSVQKSGSTTQVTSGVVEATGVTVNYGGGDTVYDAVTTTVCSGPGDSGGAHFSGSTALGIHSGSGGCSDGVNGSAIFQPVTEALSAYGVNVY